VRCKSRIEGARHKGLSITCKLPLGANPSHVLSLVLHQFSRPVGAGLLVGLGGAAALSQIVRRLLYGVSNLDPVAYLGSIGLLVVTVALALLLPARRALRVDPMRALRYD
jgi:ABC-type lipoprotein release transport system permease subunit